jgi:hypothetical protein
LKELEPLGNIGTVPLIEVVLDACSMTYVNDALPCWNKEREIQERCEWCELVVRYVEEDGSCPARIRNVPQSTESEDVNGGMPCPLMW